MQDWSRAPRGYRELRTSAVVVEMPDLAIFRLSGADHRSWLQGQCTNDVGKLDARPSLDFCLTKPTGQILSLCRAWPDGSGLKVATCEPEALRKRAEETVIMEDVLLERLDEIVCLQGPLVGDQGLAFDLTGAGGCLVHTPPPGTPLLSLEGWNLATLECGHPLKGIDFSEKTLPPELGLAFEAQYVSYQKGCYTGQEVLMRIRSRGHTNKTWVGLRSATSVTPGTAVLFDGKEVGVVHRSALSPEFGHIAAATLKNAATKQEALVLVGSVEATVFEHPILSPSS